MNTHSAPAIFANASARSMPRSGVTSFSALARAARMPELSEPCGSPSMTSTRLPATCAWAASCALSVVLPAPPLREASVMTFIGRSLNCGGANVAPYG